LTVWLEAIQDKSRFEQYPTGWEPSGAKANDSKHPTTSGNFETDGQGDGVALASLELGLLPAEFTAFTT
jgi:hypothetical protein